MGLLSRVAGRAGAAVERAVFAVAQAGVKVARAGKPSSANLTQLQGWNTTIWTVAAIKTALELHERGDFSESAKLANGFGRDDRISACTNTRVRALVGRNGVNLQIVASEDGDQRSVGRIRDMTEERFFSVCTEAVLSRIQHDAIHLGVSISRLVWAFDKFGREWLPTIVPWDMQWVRWDDVKQCFVTQTTTGEIDILPNTGEWLIVAPGGEKSWLSGAVRSLGMPSFFRNATWQDWARYCEKHGVPILAIEEPPVGTDTTAKTTKEKFYAGLRRLGREGILRLPKSADGKNGYSAEIIEPKTLSYPAFAKFLERLDVCIAVHLLGQNLSTEVSGGSFAAAIAQNRIRLDYLAADAEALTSALREQVWMWWGRFNFDNWDDSLCPWAVWATGVPEDAATKAKTLADLGKAVGPLVKAGVPIDLRKLADQYNIPLLSEQDALKAAEEAAAKAKAEADAAPKPVDEKSDENEDDAQRASVIDIRRRARPRVAWSTREQIAA